MKRILSLMLAVVLVISMIITVNAVNISDEIIYENEIKEIIAE